MSFADSDFNSAFFDEDIGSVSAVPDGGAAILVNFFLPGHEIPTDGGVIISKDYVAQCLDAQAPATSLVIDSVTYYVIKSVPDGTGLTYVYLSKDVRA